MEKDLGLIKRIKFTKPHVQFFAANPGAEVNRMKKGRPKATLVLWTSWLAHQKLNEYISWKFVWLCVLTTPDADVFFASGTSCMLPFN